MEKCIGKNHIILLLDNYSKDSQYLHESLLLAEYECLVIVLEENYFLPEGVISVYELLSGNADTEEECHGSPRFFNEILVPEGWSINAENEKVGRICYQHEEKGKIYYVEGVQKHLIMAVDWYDRKGVVRVRDHYNRYGEMCARTVFDADGHPVNKSWISREGLELLTENIVTGDMILNDKDKIKFFRTKSDMIAELLIRAGIEQSRIFFNSLSMPLLISNRLKSEIKRDVLFWQGEAGDSVPEEMWTILNGQANRVGKIVVQKKKTYDKLLELGAKNDMLRNLGLIYSFSKENRHNTEALICTNSERIEHCEELIRVLPQMHFHIAAVTQMSPNLMRLEFYDNVTLYPNVKTDTLSKLFEKCDYYFDINYYAEIVTAVRRAFLNNQLIFAFQETVHDKKYVADEYIYPSKDFHRMVADIRLTMENYDLAELHLQRQHKTAMAEDKERYRMAID